MTLLAQSDEELLRQMMAGNEEAFTLLYSRRQGAIYRFALHMSGCRAIAEDVTQDSFLVLISEGGRYDSSKGSVATYLYGIARNHVLRRFRRDRLLVPLDDSGAQDCDPGGLVSLADPHGDLTRNETVEIVRDAVLTLPPHYREVVILCDLEEMAYVEAACVLGCAVGTVRSRLHRGRALLVEKLRTNEDANADPEETTSARCFA